MSASPSEGGCESKRAQGAAPFTPAVANPPFADAGASSPPSRAGPTTSLSLHPAQRATIFPAHSCAIRGWSRSVFRNIWPAGSGAVRRARCSSEVGYWRKRA